MQWNRLTSFLDRNGYWVVPVSMTGVILILVKLDMLPDWLINIVLAKFRGM
jgi:hypothetical protein